MADTKALDPQATRDGHKYGAKLEELENHATSRAGTVRLNKETMTFYGVVGELYVSSQDGTAVRQWVTDEIRKQREVLDWKPVIEVTYAAPRREWHTKKPSQEVWEEEGDADIGIERFHIAKLGDGWRRLDWDDLVSDPYGHESYRQFGAAAGALPASDYGERHGSSERALLPYTEETFAALQQLRANLNAVRVANCAAVRKLAGVV